MTEQVRGRYFARAVAALAGLVVVASLAVPAPPADAQPLACPEPYPINELDEGMMAKGYTVEKGYTPTEFDVEILGVLEDGLAPGKDLIVIEAKGAMMERIGTIWAGMSGSPVYIGDRLVGAVAYGLTWGPSLIGGVTPAEDMFEVLDYPDAEPAAQPRKVRLGKGMKRRVARATGVARSQVGNLEQLMVPLSMSGVNRRGLRAMKKTLAREDAPFIPYIGAASSGATSPSDATIEAGDSFAGALSYGDVTFAGVGTATFVCEGKVVAFGHPFFWEGQTTLGANAAKALTIVSDPTFGGYKLATVENLVGTVEQDRFSAIRAKLGAGPSTIPINSTVESLDTGRSRTGQTLSVLSDFIPFLTFFHSFMNIDVVFDEIGPGSSSVTWTVSGTTESGFEWQLNRSNRYTSRWDISWDSLWELLNQLYIILNNPFEEIEFSDVTLDVDVEETIRQYKMESATWSLDEKTFSDKRRIRVAGGESLYLRVLLEPFDGGENVTLDLTVDVPRRRVLRKGGVVEIFGGNRGEGEEFFCFSEFEECGGGMGKVDSFADLLDHLQSAPLNNDLSAQLRAGRRMRVKSSDVETLDQVVDGHKHFRLRLKGTRRGGAPSKGESVAKG